MSATSDGFAKSAERLPTTAPVATAAATETYFEGCGGSAFDDVAAAAAASAAGDEDKGADEGEDDASAVQTTANPPCRSVENVLYRSTDALKPR